MIPKVIHLCWFSGDPYPPLIQHCIESWKKEMPDYKIKLWDARKAKAIGNKFVDEALEKKKYAFAADVVRLFALYTEGGVYLDSDVFLKKSIEPLLQGDFVTAIEFHEKIVDPAQLDSEGRRIKEGAISGIGVQAAFLASVPRHPIVNNILEYYENRNFIKEDGSLDCDVIAPAIFAERTEKFGFRYKNERQNLENNSIVYPSSFVTGNVNYDHSKAYAIHCCQHSWFKYSGLQKIKRDIRKFLVKSGFLKDELSVIFNLVDK